MATFKAYATTEDFKGNPIFLNNVQVIESNDEDQAIEAAQSLADQYHGHNVYIFAQNDQGATGFVNPDGFGMDAVNWGK